MPSSPHHQLLRQAASLAEPTFVETCAEFLFSTSQDADFWIPDDFHHLSRHRGGLVAPLREGAERPMAYHLRRMQPDDSDHDLSRYTPHQSARSISEPNLTILVLQHACTIRQSREDVTAPGRSIRPAVKSSATIAQQAHSKVASPDSSFRNKPGMPTRNFNDLGLALIDGDWNGV